MKKIVVICLSILMMVSCSRWNTISRKSHLFGEKASKVVWIQVPGLRPEHIAFLKFYKKGAEQTSSFERSSCIGNLWQYNLYDLRPSFEKSYLSQMTGHMNVKGTCEDYKRPGIWQDPLLSQHAAYIIEVGDPKTSLLNARKCEKQSFLSGLTFWRMGKKGKGEVGSSFHTQKAGESLLPGVYYDTACQQGVCHSTLFSNVIALYEQLNRSREQLFLVVRDTRYFEALKEKNVMKSRELLTELEKIYNYFSLIVSSQPDTLLLLTSSAPLNFEFPRNGKEWEEFEKSGKKVIYRNQGFIGAAMAMGARAENFCGFYEEHEVYNRILWTPKRHHMFIKMFD